MHEYECALGWLSVKIEANAFDRRRFTEFDTLSCSIIWGFSLEDGCTPIVEISTIPQ
jgi:hypothetical protein